MRDSKVIQALAGLVAVGSVVAITITLHGGFPPGIEAEPHEAAGWAMARQTLARLQPGGTVMVFARDTKESNNPATDIQLASFQRELQKASTKISAIQVLQTDPLRPMEVPPADFQQCIRKALPGSVIVSFMGPPVLSATQRKQLGEIKPAILAFCPGNWPERVNLASLIDQGLLHAAIVSRRNPSVAAARPQNLQAWFDQNFTVVTAANVGDLAAVSRNPLSAGW